MPKRSEAEKERRRLYESDPARLAKRAELERERRKTTAYQAWLLEYEQKPGRIERQRATDRKRNKTPARQAQNRARAATPVSKEKRHKRNSEPTHKERLKINAQQFRKTTTYRKWLNEYEKTSTRKSQREIANRKWRDTNPAKIQDIRRGVNSRRRARLANVENTFTPAEWQTLRARSKHCHWCKTPFTAKLRPTHDHVIPLSKGGGNTLANSCCACKTCNSRKSAGSHNPITGQLILL